MNAPQILLQYLPKDIINHIILDYLCTQESTKKIFHKSLILFDKQKNCHDCRQYGRLIAKNGLTSKKFELEYAHVYPLRYKRIMNHFYEHSVIKDYYYSYYISE